MYKTQNYLYESAKKFLKVPNHGHDILQYRHTFVTANGSMCLELDKMKSAIFSWILCF